MCPFGGLMVYDGFYHMGTFCGDGSFTLPIGKTLPLATSQLTLIEYSTPGKGKLSFSYTVDLVLVTSAIHNPCNFAEQQYVLYEQLNIPKPTLSHNEGDSQWDFLCSKFANQNILIMLRTGHVKILLNFQDFPKYLLYINWFYNYLDLQQTCKYYKPK